MDAIFGVYVLRKMPSSASTNFDEQRPICLVASYGQSAEEDNIVGAGCQPKNETLLPLFLDQPLVTDDPSSFVNLNIESNGQDLIMDDPSIYSDISRHKLLPSIERDSLFEIIIVGQRKASREKVLEDVPLFEFKGEPVRFELAVDSSKASERTFATYISKYPMQIRLSGNNMGARLYQRGALYETFSTYNPLDGVRVGQVTLQW